MKSVSLRQNPRTVPGVSTREKRKKQFKEWYEKNKERQFINLKRYYYQNKEKHKIRTETIRIAKRINWYEKQGNKCNKCPSTEYLEIHHLKYTLNPEDWELLCRNCHRIKYL